MNRQSYRRKAKCKNDGVEYQKLRMGHDWCSIECGVVLGMKRLEKRQRKEIRERKEAIKRRSEWESECRKIVQKIARIRDKDDGCISCHLPASWDGQWHGSHFRSHGACSVLQFHLWNIHKSCSSCNRDKGGNIGQYRPRLVAKIGQEKVDWLEAQNGTFKPPIDYYKRFKTVMGKWLKRLEKRNG